MPHTWNCAMLRRAAEPRRPRRLLGWRHRTWALGGRCAHRARTPRVVRHDRDRTPRQPITMRWPRHCAPCCGQRPRLTLGRRDTQPRRRRVSERAARRWEASDCACAYAAPLSPRRRGSGATRLLASSEAQGRGRPPVAMPHLDAEWAARDWRRCVGDRDHIPGRRCTARPRRRTGTRAGSSTLPPLRPRAPHPSHER